MQISNTDGHYFYWGETVDRWIELQRKASGVQCELRFAACTYREDLRSRYMIDITRIGEEGEEDSFLARVETLNDAEQFIAALNCIPDRIWRRELELGIAHFYMGEHKEKEDTTNQGAPKC